MSETGALRSPRILPLLVALTVVAAYAGSLPGAFVFDDIRWIVRSPSTHGFSAGLLRHGRPVLDLTFALNYALHGLHPAGYRAVNVAVHACASLLLYGVLRRLFGRREAGAGHARASRLAAFAAALWGAHPLTTGSVTYIAQRAESMVGCLLLLAFYAALRVFELSADAPAGAAPARGDGTAAARLVWVAVATAAGWLGMGTKETMVTAPLLVFLYDSVFVAGGPLAALRRRPALHAGLASSWAALALAAAARRAMDTDAFYAWEGIPPWRYFVTQWAVVVHYLRLAFWPAGLCLDYDWLPARSAADFWPQGVLLLALGAAGVAALLRRRLAGFAAAWFFIILAPTSSFIPRPDCAFEHRMYLPLAAVLATAAALAARGMAALARPALRAAAGVALVVTAASGTALRNRDYGDEVALWRSVVAVRPDNLRARNDLAAALSEAGRTDEAMAAYEDVLARLPSDLRRDMAAGRHRAAIPFRKQSPEYHFFRAHANMGLLLARELGDMDGAIAHFEAALAVAPFDEEVRAKLALAQRIKRRAAADEKPDPDPAAGRERAP